MTSTNRISITRRTSRWSDDDVTIADAMDLCGFAAGAANVIMQLSAPGVGHGVVESTVDSGNLLKHPWKRARTTLSYLAVAILGNPEDRAAFRDAVDTAHRQVRSGPASPVQYNAFDRDLQMWVAACLFVRARGCLPTAAWRDDRSSGRAVLPLPPPHWATTLQVDEQQWPPTRADFDTYWDTACAHVQMDDVVREYLHDLVDLRDDKSVAAPSPFRPLLKFLTAGFLAPVFPGRRRLRLGPRAATVVRMAVSGSGVRQSVPARVHPAGAAAICCSPMCAGGWQPTRR
jgi:uncharacterized protein (DUF2236 family)